jgi:ABC-type glycerol-3-phosphate transport system substrate-binding protein
VNFAIRKAVVDLTRFDDLAEIQKRFHESAMVPYTFDNRVYALPETQTFLMMFYRTDIFGELSLSPPKTWEDFFALAPKLQRRNMQIGFPNAAFNGVRVFLYQQNGSLYNRSLTKSNLYSDEFIDAFQKQVNMFTLYRFPLEYDFANRFRSGEMPLGIMDYTVYNQLAIFAPEIKGLWEMRPIPGTAAKDGSVNNVSPSDGTAVMMLKDVKNAENAWEFMKWWTSDEIQSRFAVEMESILGPGGKFATANRSALYGMPWSAAEYRSLAAQMEHLAGTPEIPGGYYTQRAVAFAFNEVYTQGTEPVTAILNNVGAVDEEIERKRTELFGAKAGK